VITWRKELYLPSTIIYEEPAGGDTTYVHRLQTVGPRAWLVNQAEIAPDQTLLSKIADPGFDRWHIALLEPGAEPFVKSLRQATPLPPISESANSGFTAEPGMGKSEAGFTSHLSPLTFHSPQSLAVEVSTPGPALLIFSETYYPGWQATVDGRPEPLLRADFVLRAVPIPPGQHQVALTFRPLSFRMGAIVTVLTLLMTAAALISLYLKSKKVKP
jgi:hypothetical protein